MDLPNVRKLGRLRRTRVRFPNTPYDCVAQMVRALACHARSRRFDPGHGRLGVSLAFDDVSEFGLNANNIVSFERAAVAA